MNNIKKITLVLLTLLRVQLEASQLSYSDFDDSKSQYEYSDLSVNSLSSDYFSDPEIHEYTPLELTPLGDHGKSAIMSQLEIHCEPAIVEEIINLLNEQWATIQNDKLKNTIFNYFINVGHFYLPILKKDPKTWVTQSLIFDIVQPIKKQEQQSHYLQHLNLFIYEYQSLHTPQKAEELLYLIHHYQRKQSLEEAELRYLLNHIREDMIQELLKKNEPGIRYKAYKKEIRHRVFKEINLSVEIQNVIIDALTRSIHPQNPSMELWKEGSYDILFQYLKLAKDRRSAFTLIDFIDKNKVGINLLEQAHAHAQKKKINTLSGFQQALYYVFLRKTFIEPQKKYINEDRINAPLWNLFNQVELSNCYNLLHKLYYGNTYYGFSYKVLLLLADFAPHVSYYEAISQIILDEPRYNWVAKVHEYLLKITFSNSHEFSPREVIEYIAKSAKKNNLRLDVDQLVDTYQRIDQTYRKDRNRQDCIFRLDQFNNQTTQPQVFSDCIKDWSKKRIQQWAKSYKKGQIPIYETLAVIQRAVEIHAQYRPRAVQLITTLCLLQGAKIRDLYASYKNNNNSSPLKGCLAQVMTGQGKSLIIAILAIIHVLNQHRVDIITTSPELSKPEAKAKKGLYEMFGITVGENSPAEEMRFSDLFFKEGKQSQDIYQQDIVYGTPSNFEADLLRTSFFGKTEIRGKREFDIGIVDEVDTMFLDQRGYSTRIAEYMPGMDVLEIPMAVVWNRIVDITNHMTAINGRTYFITEDFKKEGEHIILSKSKTLDECAIPVKDLFEFTKDLAYKELKVLFRTLTSEEKKAWEEAQSIEKKINQYEDESFQIKEENASEYVRLLTQYKIDVLKKDRKNSTWEKKGYAPFLEIPNYLLAHVQQELKDWINHALYARYVYTKEHHYDVVDGQIVPIDYQNTGVLQKNLVWNKGLSQFLRIKEDLLIAPESLATNYLSNVALFCRYKNIYGLTGTLGTTNNCLFLCQTYQVSCFDVPPHKKRTILGNEDPDVPYKYLTPYLCTDLKKYTNHLLSSIIQYRKLGQGILIIVPTIQKAKLLQKVLVQSGIKDSVLYTGQKSFDKKNIKSGEVIIATNIAGRGTDIITTELVEKYGGLHVCLTFFPTYYRVERQNGGRTARSGKKGTFQIVVYSNKAQTVKQLYKEREEREKKEMESAQKGVQSILFKDRLFQDFCDLLGKIFPDRQQYYQYMERAQLEASWKNLKKVADKQEERLKKNKSLSDAYTNKIKNRKALFHFFVNTLGKNIKKRVSLNVWSNFVKQTKINAKPKEWGPAIRKSLEERWGIWLYTIDQKLEKGEYNAVQNSFNQFKKSVIRDAKNDSLAHNPYYYVLEGNAWSCKGLYPEAVKLYNRAIKMDPHRALFAFYNKAYCLIKQGGEFLNEAQETLEKAKEVLREYYKPNLITLHSLLTEKGNKKTISSQVQRKLNLILLLEEEISTALGEINYAFQEQKEIMIHSCKTLEEALSSKKFPNKDQMATPEEIVALCEDGLTHLFTLEAVNPIPWNHVVAVSFIGLAESTVGGALIVFSAGTGSSVGYALMKEGIGDLIQGVRTTYTREFSWKEWGIDKGVSLTVSLVTAGIQNRGKLLSQAAQESKGACQAVRRVRKNVSTVYRFGQTKEITKGFKLVGQRVGLSIAQSAAKQCINYLAEYTIDHTILNQLQCFIATQITPYITKAIESNHTIKKAIAIDIQNKNNYWQDQLIKLGESIIRGSWSGKLQDFLYNQVQGKFAKENGEQDKKANILYRIMRGIAMRNIPNVVKAFEATAAGVECSTYTHEFLKELETKIESQYKKSTRKEQKFPYHYFITSNDQFSKLSFNNDCSHNNNCDDDDEKDAISPALYDPSSTQKLISSYKDAISAKLKERITQTIVRPSISALSSWGIDEICSEAEQALRKKIENYQFKNKVLNSLDDVKEVDDEKKEEKENKGSGDDEEAVDILIEGTEKGDEGNMVHVQLLAKKFKAPVIVYNEAGEKLTVLGGEEGGEPIELVYQAPVDGKPGHWAPRNLANYEPSDHPTNCLFDSIAAVVNQRGSQQFNAQMLRKSCGQQIRHNREALAPCIDALYILTINDPSDVYMGAGLLNDAIGVCMYCERKWEEFKRKFPLLLKALKGVNYAAGVGFFVVGARSAIAAGGVGGAAYLGINILGEMAINELYDYVLDHCEDQIRGIKESIAQFLMKQDSDLKEEHAQWAADKLMKLLIEGGRMLLQYAGRRALAAAKKAATRRKNYIKKRFKKKNQNQQKPDTKPNKPQSDYKQKTQKGGTGSSRWRNSKSTRKGGGGVKDRKNPTTGNRLTRKGKNVAPKGRTKLKKPNKNDNLGSKKGSKKPRSSRKEPKGKPKKQLRHINKQLAGGEHSDTGVKFCENGCPIFESKRFCSC